MHAVFYIIGVACGVGCAVTLWQTLAPATAVYSPMPEVSEILMHRETLWVAIALALGMACIISLSTGAIMQTLRRNGE